MAAHERIHPFEQLAIGDRPRALLKCLGQEKGKKASRAAQPEPWALS
jgi:hypothetical protein